jgi:isoleucyl-tRNA synthetase
VTLSQNFKPDLAAVQSKLNVMDQWILSVQQSLIQFTREEMKGSHTHTTHTLSLSPRLCNRLFQLS